jgi:hypothetical protein
MIRELEGEGMRIVKRLLPLISRVLIEVDREGMMAGIVVMLEITSVPRRRNAAFGCMGRPGWGDTGLHKI